MAAQAPAFGQPKISLLATTDAAAPLRPGISRPKRWATVRAFARDGLLEVPHVFKYIDTVRDE